MMIGYRNVRASYSVPGGTLYPASGMLSDFAKAKAGIPYSYAVELPNTGPDLFLNPPEDIVPIAESFVLGMREMLLDLAHNAPRMSKMSKAVAGWADDFEKARHPGRQKSLLLH